MSSLFDTYVRSRREHTPWATVGFIRFLKEMIWNGTEKPEDNNWVIAPWPVKEPEKSVRYAELDIDQANNELRAFKILSAAWQDGCGVLIVEYTD